MTAAPTSYLSRERIIFLHGSLGGAPGAFSGQKALSSRFDISIPARRGYALTEAADAAVDHEGDAVDIAALAADGAHLVGTSTGAVTALLAAALRPAHIRSLTLIEPPLFQIASDLPDVAAAIAALEAHWGRGGELDERAFMAGFLQALHMGRPVPDHIDPALSRGIAMLRTDRLWALDAPLDAVVEARIPVMIVSGGWSRVYDAVCERLAKRLAAPLHCIPGHGHAVQTADLPFNELLTAHIEAAVARQSYKENEHASDDR